MDFFEPLLDGLKDQVSEIADSGPLLLFLSVVVLIVAGLVWEAYSDVLKEELKPWIRAHRWRLTTSIVLSFGAWVLFRARLVWAPLILLVYALCLLGSLFLSRGLGVLLTRKLTILAIALVFIVIWSLEFRRLSRTPMRMCVVLAVDNNGLEKHDEIYPLWGKIDKVLTAALHQSSLRIHPRVVDDKVYAALAQDPVRYVKSQGLGNALLLATQAEISESGDSHLLKVVQNLKRLVHGEPQQIAAVQICHETELQDAEYLSIVTAADIIREVSSIPGYQLSPEEQNKVRRALLSSFSDFANLRSEKIKPETINAVRKFLAADEKESIDVREFSRLLNDYQISECGARTTASAGKLRRSYEEKLKLNQ